MEIFLAGAWGKPHLTTSTYRNCPRAGPLLEDLAVPIQIGLWRHLMAFRKEDKKTQVGILTHVAAV